MEKQDTYFLKNKDSTRRKPRQKKVEIASVIFPPAKKTIIEPIKISNLPADRMDDFTLTPYDIDPVDGLPTAEYLQENPDLISTVTGDARTMLTDKLRKAKELKIQSQKALLELPKLTRDSIQDRREGTIALLNVMQSLPERIRAPLLELINEQRGQLPAEGQEEQLPAEGQEEQLPAEGQEEQLPAEGQEEQLPAEGEAAEGEVLKKGPDTERAFDEFKTKYDRLSIPERKEVLSNLRQILGLKGQSKREADIFKDMQSRDFDDLATQYRLNMRKFRGPQYEPYRKVMAPYNVMQL
jgi:hypothetical protein